MLNDNKYTGADNFVDEVLKQEPEFLLPEDFAEKLSVRIEKKMAWSSYLKEFLIYFGAIVGIIVTALGVIFLFNAESWGKIVEMIISKSNLVIGIGVIVLFVLFADKVLLRYFSHKAQLQKMD